MDYKAIYDRLCSKAKLENRIKGNGVYYEIHHIIPLCMGGEGVYDQYREHPNLVPLTAKEHLLAHRLLHYSDPKNVKLLHAYRCMALLQRDGRKYYLSGREYDYIRNEYSKTIDLDGENNPFYGKSHTQITLDLLREKAKHRYSDKSNHPMFGKSQSDESISKNRNSQKKSVKAFIFDLQTKEYILEGTWNQANNFFINEGISFYKGPTNVFKSRQFVLVNCRYYYCEGYKHSVDVIKNNVKNAWGRNVSVIATHQEKPTIIFGSIYDAVNFIKNNFKCKSPSYQNMEKHLNLTNDKKREWVGYKFNYNIVS